jgi:hypothetical protein
MYKNEMKKSYKAGDTEKGEYYHLMQYTMKILLNSLYGATALNSFRYGMPLSILSEAITLSGWRIIQESALVANRHMNKVIRNEIELDLKLNNKKNKELIFESGSLEEERYSDSNGTTRILGSAFGL